MTLAYLFSDDSCPENSSSTLQLANLLPDGTVQKLSLSEFSKIQSLKLESADKASLQWLKEHAPNCLNKGDPLPLDIELLRWIAGSAKLFFRKKRVVCDLFSKNTFLYSVSRKHENWVLEGKIKEKAREFYLHECDAIRGGKHSCYIYKGLLKFIDNDVPWRHLRTLYLTPHLSIDKEWREYLYSMKEEPYLRTSDPSFFEPSDPLPILHLTDRTGGFALLKMDYNGNILPYSRTKTSDALRKFSVEKQWEADLLETDFSWKPVGNSEYYCPLDKVAKSLTFLLELGWKILDHRGNQILLSTKTSFEIEESPQHVKLKGTLNYGSHQAHLEDTVGCFNRKEKFIPLGEGTVGLLPENLNDIETIAMEGEWVTDALLLSTQKVGLLAPLFAQTDHFVISDSLRAFCTGNKTIEKILVSDLFNGKLRSYQQEGVNWLMFLYKMGLNGLLADDMGLGKTVQIIAFLAALEKHAAPTLIVVPTTLLHNWKQEIKQFFPNTTVYIHHGLDRSVDHWNVDIIITTYSTLRIDLNQFQPQQFHCVILDEAHFIKNSSTQIAQAVFSVNAQFKVSLTGTPIENNLNELWSQFQFLMPGLLGNKDHFSADVSASSYDPRFIDRIRKQVKPFILRRSKKEVAPELPEKIEQTIWIEMSPEQRMLYDSFLSGAKKNLLTKVKLDGTSKHRFEIFEVLLRLRQICCHPGLIAGQYEEAMHVKSSKMEQLFQELDIFTEEQTKVLIYSQFTTLLTYVSKYLQEKQTPFLYLDGKTTNRGEIVERFQTESVPFFLISLKAGGVGLNLTAADYVLILDPWWNEAAEQQAIDRAHRIGRTEPVIAKRYVVLDSIEEKMMKLKENKTKLSMHLFENQNSESQLSLDDFEWLLT